MSYNSYGNFGESEIFITYLERVKYKLKNINGKKSNLNTITEQTKLLQSKMKNIWKNFNDFKKMKRWWRIKSREKLIIY